VVHYTKNYWVSGLHIFRTQCFENWISFHSEVEGRGGKYAVGSVKKNQISITIPKCCVLFGISDYEWHTEHSNPVLFLCLSNKKGNNMFRWYKYQFCSYSQAVSLCEYQLAFEWIHPKVWLTQMERLLNLVLIFCKILCRVCYFRHLYFIYWFIL
jgi:hypothetical protein